MKNLISLAFMLVIYSEVFADNRIISNMDRPVLEQQQNYLSISAFSRVHLSLDRLFLEKTVEIKPSVIMDRFHRLYQKEIHSTNVLTTALEIFKFVELADYLNDMNSILILMVTDGIDNQLYGEDKRKIISEIEKITSELSKKNVKFAVIETRKFYSNELRREDLPVLKAVSAGDKGHLVNLPMFIKNPNLFDDMPEQGNFIHLLIDTSNSLKSEASAMDAAYELIMNRFNPTLVNFVKINPFYLLLR